MKITSKNFVDNSNIPSEFTCDGRNISPQLAWENVPNATKSFALGVTDPDALGGWIHWLVYDISKEIQTIEQDSLPAGAKEVENDFGKNPMVVHVRLQELTDTFSPSMPVILST